MERARYSSRDVFCFTLIFFNYIFFVLREDAKEQRRKEIIS
jgi:cbb3-type cytochrome oxidase subunit 3